MEASVSSTRLMARWYAGANIYTREWFRCTFADKTQLNKTAKSDRAIMTLEALHHTHERQAS